MTKKTRGRARSPKAHGEPGGAAQFVDNWRAERPDIDFDWMSVTVRIHEIEQAFRGDLAKAVAPSVGGGLADFDVIAHLRAAGPPYALRPTDLFRAMSLTSGAVTGRIDRLVALGWVTRDPSTLDRRAWLIRLTRRGIEVSDWLAEYGASASVVARALGAMSAAERQGLIGALDQLHAAITGAQDTGETQGPVAPAKAERRRGALTRKS